MEWNDYLRFRENKVQEIADKYGFIKLYSDQRLFLYYLDKTTNYIWYVFIPCYDNNIQSCEPIFYKPGYNELTHIAQINNLNSFQCDNQPATLI